jgi:hypothetical protein
VLRRGDSTLAAVLYELGVSLGRLGRYSEASAQLRRAEAITVDVYGSEHVYVSFIVAARADVLMMQSRWREAAALYERALPVFERSEGTQEVLASGRANRCLAYIELHQPRRALAELEHLALVSAPPEVRPIIEFALARALWDTRGDHQRAHALAGHALAGLQAIADARREDVSQIERWLTNHRTAD